MTVHKAQVQTMGCVIVDIAGCTGTEPPYAMVLRATSFSGLRALHNFDFRQMIRRIEERVLPSDASEVANNRKVRERYRG